MANVYTIGLTVSGDTLTAYLRGAALITLTERDVHHGHEGWLRSGSLASSASAIRYDE